MPSDPNEQRCSFCGKAQDQVRRLVAGGALPGAFICNECVLLAAEERSETWDPHRKTWVPADRLSHLDESGQARMVDVGAKPTTERRAVARGMLRLSPATIRIVRDGRTPKGDVLSAARLAGIMAAKRTSELIPLTHPLPLTHVSVELAIEDGGIAIEATAATTAQTGVEMEALTAVTVAGLTLYDMLKSVERTARLTDVRLIEKSGGRSGHLRLE